MQDLEGIMDEAQEFAERMERGEVSEEEFAALKSATTITVAELEFAIDQLFGDEMADEAKAALVQGIELAAAMHRIEEMAMIEQLMDTLGLTPEEMALGCTGDCAECPKA